jgi:long-chain acyl-CoA synthetase
MAATSADTQAFDHPQLSSFLFEHPSAPGDPIAFSYDGQTTLADVQADVARVARALDLCGVAPQQPVAHIVTSGATALTVMFGVWQARAVYVPINGRLTESEIRALLDTAPPAAIIAQDAGRFDGVAACIETLLEQRWRVHTVCRPWQGELLPAGTALVMRTSGTTGDAKPIMLTHAGVAEGIDTVLSSLRASKPDTGHSSRRAMPNLIPASLALWAGLWNVLFALRAGSPVVLMDRFDTVEFATLVQRHAIRSTVLAPGMMAMLTEDPRVLDLAPLTMVRSITAPLTPHQARAFHAKFGVGVMNCYGQTELGGEVIGWTAKDLREHGENKLGSVGRPHRGIEVSIRDAAGTELAAGGVGEIWIHSPFATRDDQIAAQTVEGFLRTGDIGRLDDDGFLWLEGRASDVINRGGLKVLPQEIEEQLCARPEVAEACVAGVPDGRLGEVPVAWLRAAAGASIDTEVVLAGLRDTLAGYKVPVQAVLVNELPRNEIGKVLRRTLVQRWVDRGDNGEEGTS